ncbi:MAG: hypothetical protein QNJ97_09770 [Myxococcota bacterium]|nr:hypothetical protein [Myxococcota bacterium]
MTRKTPCAPQVQHIGMVLCSLLLLHCEATMDSNDSSNVDWDEDDGAADADVDGDSDSDADSDADADTDSDVDPDEDEEEASYRIPQGSGRYVFIADEANNAVVVVDSLTLAISVVDVGRRPTHLVPLADDNAAAVLSLDSDEVTLIRVDDGGMATTQDIPVRPDTNALAASPDGRYVIAYWDPKFVDESGPPNTDQEISVIQTDMGASLVVHMTVGMHPWQVVFNETATRAFVITEGGIAVIKLDALESSGIPETVELFQSGTFKPEDVDILVVPNGTWAIGRRNDAASMVAVRLDLLGASSRQYSLPDMPTDLDISADGTFGLFVLRASSQVAFFNLPLPEDETADPFTYVSLADAIVGVASLTPNGQHVLLHTTTGGGVDDQRRLSKGGSHNLRSWSARSALSPLELTPRPQSSYTNK